MNKELLKARLPAPLLHVAEAVNAQRPHHRRNRKSAAERRRVAAAVYDRCGGEVVRGPFAGLRFTGPTADSGSKCTGSYESELHPAIEDLVGRGFPTVLNIGCAEGYYAVGFAMRLPEARVVAYDIAEHYQALCAKTAAANGARVEVRGECDTAELDRLGPGALIVIDCEGAEDELLDPVAAPGLREATILVELHPFDDPGVPERVIGRFTGSHRIDLVLSETPDPARYPEVQHLPPADQVTALFERPVQMTWALMSPTHL